VDIAAKWENDILDSIYNAQETWYKTFVLQYVSSYAIVDDGERELLECVMHFVMSVIRVAIRLPQEIIVSHILRLNTNVVHYDLGLFPDTNLDEFTYATNLRSKETSIGEYTLKVLVNAHIQQQFTEAKDMDDSLGTSPEQIVCRVCQATMKCFQTQNNTHPIDQRVIQHTADQLPRMKQKIETHFHRHVPVSSDWKWIHKLFIKVWNASRYPLVQYIVTTFLDFHILPRANTSLVVNTMVQLLQSCLGIQENEKRNIYSVRILEHLTYGSRLTR
jgi:hypothetical protein